MGVPLARWLVATLLALKAIDDFFATALTIAYQVGALGVAEHLGRATPGDDYRRYIPLMDAVPVWLHGVWVGAGVLYLVAIASVLGRKGGAPILLIAAVALEIVAVLAGRPIAAAAGVPNPDPGGVALAIRVALPLLLAVALWWSGRHASASIPASRSADATSPERRSTPRAGRRSRGRRRGREPGSCCRSR